MDWDSLKQYLLVVSDAGGSADSLRQLVIRLATSGHLQQKPAEVSTWLRSKLGEIITLQYGKNLPAKKRNDQGSIPVYGSNGIVGVHDESLIDDPCIVVGRKGSSGALNVSKTPCWPTDVTYFVIPPDNIDLGFCFLMLKSLQLESLGKGIKPGLNRKEAYALEVTVPPLAEQKRIVAKVDELMALIDDLEQKQSHREEVRQRFQTAALDALVKAEGPDELKKTWGRVANHWSICTSRAIDTSNIKQSIIDLATNEAFGLIESANSAIEWNEVNLEDLIEDIRYGTSKKCSYDTGSIPVLRIPNVTNGLIDISDLKMADFDSREIEKWQLKTGDLLVIRSNGSTNLVGRPAVVTTQAEGYLYAGYLVRLRLDQSLANPSFVTLSLNSSKVRKQIELPIRTTSGVKNINSTEIKRLNFWLPPLEEQKRIVAKVDELMKLCNKLEEHLKTKEELGNRLAEAVVAAA